MFDARFNPALFDLGATGESTSRNRSDRLAVMRGLPYEPLDVPEDVHAMASGPVSTTYQVRGLPLPTFGDFPTVEPYNTGTTCGCEARQVALQSFLSRLFETLRGSGLGV